MNSQVRGFFTGALKTQFTKEELDRIDFENEGRLYNRYWDFSRLRSYTTEVEHSFFVPTNVFITVNQTLGQCTPPALLGKPCRNDQDCITLQNWTHFNTGIETGTCNISSEVCEVTAWCPVEDDTLLSLTSPVLR